jgi:lipoate-protein ligase A
LDTWRLLKLETHDAFMNMAIDESILRARIAEFAPNTLRFYRWKPSAVSIGRFQKIENEVQLENCRKYGVDVVRRITGGGAVYHDAGNEITYSVIADKKDMETEDIAAIYARIYAGLAEALKILGINADFNQGSSRICPNLTVSGRKISGSAQSHKMGVVLQHGTLLLGVDLEKMFALLRVPWARTCKEIVNMARDRISSLNIELDRIVSIQEIHRALIKGFGKALNVRLLEGELTTSEREFARKLCEERYAKDVWNMDGKDIREGPYPCARSGNTADWAR